MSFAELNELVHDRMRHLILTYDKSKADDLDDDMKSSAWAPKAWDALLALDSYSASSASDQSRVSAMPGRL